jgi:hypothetical protein
MPRTTLFDSLFRTPARRRRFIYWQTVPLRRLTFLLCAIFCLFGMIAFILDLFSLGEKPFIPVLIWTLFTGVMGVSYLLVLTRRPRYIWVPLLVQVLASMAINQGIRRYGNALAHPTIQAGVRNSAIAVLVLSMAACAFFLLFIEGEGSLSVRVQTELTLAHGIQQTLVPTIEKRWPRFEIYGISVPSDKVGGDIVDVVSLSDGSVFAYVADIAGHGLSAGILMGMVKTAVRTQLHDLPSPVAVFDRLNQVLPEVKESNMYATCTALRIHAMEVEYAIAGQPAMLLASAAGSMSRLTDEQLPIGLLPGASYQSQRVELQADDILLVATDGVLEAENKAGEEFGMEQLERLLVEHRNAPLAQIATQIRSTLQRSYRQADDQTLLLIRFLA